MAIGVVGVRRPGGELQGAERHRLAATFTVLSNASENSATLPVSHQAAPLSPSTRQPMPMLPMAMCRRVPRPRPLVVSTGSSKPHRRVSLDI